MKMPALLIPGRNVYVVADGVGGNNSGEVASRTAVSEIARMVNEAAMDQYRSAGRDIWSISRGYHRTGVNEQDLSGWA